MEDAVVIINCDFRTRVAGYIKFVSTFSEIAPKWMLQNNLDD